MKLRHLLDPKRIQQGPIGQKLKPVFERLANTYIYGNTVEYYANVIGRDNWKQARHAFKQPFDRKLHRQFITQGYAVLPNAIAPETLQQLCHQYNQVIQDPALSGDPFADETVRNAYNHGGVQQTLPCCKVDIQDPPTSLSIYPDLFNERFIQFLQSCYGSHFMLDNFYAWRNLHAPPELQQHFEFHADRWHFDDQYSDRTKLFIYLTDVTEDDGPFQHFNRADSRRILRHGFQKALRTVSVTGGVADKHFPMHRLIKHTAPAGTAILCLTSFCLHRGGILAPGHHRDVLQFCLRPALQNNLTVSQ